MRFTFATVIIALACGCASPEYIQFEADEQTVHHDGADWTTTSVTARELDEIVRDFAAARQLNFDFRGLRANVFVPRSREYLANVWYGGEIGKPVLTAKVGFDRRVIEHHLATAACGTLTSPPHRASQ